MFKCTKINKEERVFLQVLKQFIDQLSSDMGMTESLLPKDDGSYSLYLEPDLHISLRENPGSGISLFSVLAPLPQVKREEFLLKTMVANLFGRETGGSILGLNKDGTKVTLLTFLSSVANYRDFHDSLEDFVNYAEAWKNETVEFNEQLD